MVLLYWLVLIICHLVLYNQNQSIVLFGMRLKSRFVAASVTIITTFYFLRSYQGHGTSTDAKTVKLHSKNNHAVNIPASAESDKKDIFIKNECQRLHIDELSSKSQFEEWPWDTAAKWVTTSQVYPEYHPELFSVLSAMVHAKIIHADVLPKGTQLKMLLILEGNQKVVFKQKRYERDYVIEGKPYDGFDRHNGEIAAFHLDRVFNYRRSPITVGRIINLREEILPVASEKLKSTFSEENGNLCYFGYCYYCNAKDKACADGDEMEGSVTLWLPEEYSKFQKLRHPYQRTYIDGRLAKWETDDNYCEMTVKKKPPYNRGRRLLDITDASVFDYLIGNADRHHYEVFKDKGDDVMLIMMDNAKSFGNPYWHEPSVLSPIRQCCLLRNSTWQRLNLFKGGTLRQLLEFAMKVDPLTPVLHFSHLEAITERLNHIIDALQHCIDEKGFENVIVNKWNGL